MDQDGVSVSVTMLLDVTSVSLSGDVVIASHVIRESRSQG
jgi:hypothetical protein